jgi:hypothetical protein
MMEVVNLSKTDLIIWQNHTLFCMNRTMHHQTWATFKLEQGEEPSIEEPPNQCLPSQSVHNVWGGHERWAQQMMAVLHWFHQAIMQIADLRTVGLHSSNMCITISKEGSHTYIVTFILNVNPILIRYFSLLFYLLVFSVASLSILMDF